MTISGRNIGLFALMALLLMSVGFIQSWDVSLTLLNLCIISAIMALGVNIQWGYAGLFNVGTGQARSFADLATAIFAAADTAPRITYVDTPQAIRDKYQYFTEARMKRLRAAGYPGQFTPLEEGVRRYVRDFLATDDPYR